MFFGTGNPSVQSTQLGMVASPTTAALLAEIDFNSTLSYVDPNSSQVTKPFAVTWIVGVITTQTVFLLDHALSTGVGATGIISQTAVPVSSNQSAEFFTQHNIRHGDRLRIRVQSSGTGSYSGKIIAVPVF